MSASSKLKAIKELISVFAKDSVRIVNNSYLEERAERFNREYTDGLFNGSSMQNQADEENPLRTYFDGVTEGNGIWKWDHYFDAYHAHLAGFRNRKINIVEIGVYSGGSLGMWREYFGAACHIHGIDIEPACKEYENEYTTIHIGDQADPEFWSEFCQNVPQIDIVIDDGGHAYDQQIASIEGVLGHMAPGGVYICEDIIKSGNRLVPYLSKLIDGYNHFDPENSEEMPSEAKGIQRAIDSLHFYPFMVVFKKRMAPTEIFRAPRHGTQWQPFFSKKNK